jgi:hypothetical protein
MVCQLSVSIYLTINVLPRLFRDAANYYDLDSWKESEAKRSLVRVRDKLLGRRPDGAPPKKKMKP